jgi:hypothetical protein
MKPGFNEPGTLVYAILVTTFTFKEGNQWLRAGHIVKEVSLKRCDVLIDEKIESVLSTHIFTTMTAANAFLDKYYKVAPNGNIEYNRWAKTSADLDDVMQS